MFFYVTLIVGFFLVAYVIRRYRFLFYNLALGSVAMVDAFLSDDPEEVKVKLVQQRNSRLVYSLLRMMVLILAALALGSVPVLLYGFFTNTALSSMDFGSLYAILAISAGATIPFLIPMGKKNRSGYSELSQLLHRMALNNYNLSYKLFKRECRRISREKLQRRNDFVIVSGLARAGTTSLMNDLSEIGDFVSLGYANMPFLMAPNYWAKVYKPKTKKLKERSHGDGIMIGLDSNEALEEYFFKVKAGDEYIHDATLSEYQISKETYEEYLDYQTIIKRNNEKIYLAKNNNFLLRYKSVREFNDDFLMVILYRDPLTHAASLMEKDSYYRNLQAQDPFVLEYMDWLGHHEFGLNQKTFVFGNSPGDIPGDRDSLDYWLTIWINYYNDVLSLNHPNTILINYASYCKKPGETIQAIAGKMGITRSLPEYRAFQNKRRTDQLYSEGLYEAAQEIYRRLDERAL